MAAFRDGLIFADIMPFLAIILRIYSCKLHFAVSCYAERNFSDGNDNKDFMPY